MYEVAVEGHLDVLKWAVENAYPKRDSHYGLAYSGGNTDVIVEWMAEAGFPWLGWSLPSSRAMGPLGDAQAHSLGEVPLVPGVCIEAAAGGHIKVMRWALCNGSGSGPRTSFRLLLRASV